MGRPAAADHNGLEILMSDSDPFSGSLGALYRPAPSAVPLLRAAAPMSSIVVPDKVDWIEGLDVTGDDGMPDALGNLLRPVCVPVAAVRMLQVQCGDGRKPTQNMVDSLFRDWDGDELLGTFTDTAFARLSSHGIQWSETRLVVPRWSVLENDGVSPDLYSLKAGVWAMGGVLAVFNMTEDAMRSDRWDVTGNMRSAGAHCVYMGGAVTGEWKVLSWAKPIIVTDAFVSARLMHASAFPNFPWVRPSGKTPSGLSFDQIRTIGVQIEGV